MKTITQNELNTTTTLDFDSITFENCDFAKFNFENAKFDNCEFNECDFSNVNLKNSEFNECDFDECEFLSDENYDSRLDFEIAAATQEYILNQDIETSWFKQYLDKTCEYIVINAYKFDDDLMNASDNEKDWEFNEDIYKHNDTFEDLCNEYNLDMDDYIEKVLN